MKITNRFSLHPAPIRLRDGSPTLLWLALLFVLVFRAATLTAQPLSLSTSISPRSGSLDETFIFSVSVKGFSGKRPELSGGTDWNISYIGPNSQVSIINGTITTSVSYSYALVPRKEGTLQTPEATLTISGQKYTAPPISVEVGAQKTQPSSGGDSSSPILRQSLSKTSVYRGEQVIHKLELTSKSTIKDVRYDDIPFDGFWQESVGQIETEQHTVRGQPEIRLTQRKALFPLRAGDIFLSRRAVTLQVRERRRSGIGFPNIFGSDDIDDFFGFAAFRTANPRSNELTLLVKELPERPSDFPDWGTSSPLVGDTELKVLYDKAPIKVGESKIVTIEVTSLGNLNPLQHAPLEDSPSFRIYQETPLSKNFENNSQLISKRSIRLSVVPLVPGMIKIAPLRLGYFDPEDTKYREARSQEIVFSVSGEAIVTPSTPTLEPAQTQAATSPTPLPSETPSALEYHEPGVFENMARSISLSFATLLVLIALVISAVVYAIVLGIRAQKAIRARRRAIDEAMTVEALRHAFLRAAEVRLGRAASSIGSLDDLRHAVSSSSTISAELRFALAAIIDEFEQLLYSGSTATQAQVTALREKIRAGLEGR